MIKVRFLLLFFLAAAIWGCQQETDSLVTISTPLGEMKVILYDETPKHKENFLNLAKQGKFDSVIFHRVIEDFMIQTGNLATGSYGESVDYQIDAEFLGDKYFHQKGALAAARQGDSSNPEKKSSGSQFYIAQGQKYDEEGLKERALRREFLKLNGFFDRLRRLDRYSELNEKYNYHVQKSRDDSTYNFGEALNKLVFDSKPIIEKEFGPQIDPGYSEKQKEVYRTIGGVPHLDEEYTVFGQVVEGLDVIDKIAAQETNYRDQPLEEIRMTVTVEELSKTEISKKYGVKYADQ